MFISHCPCLKASLPLISVQWSTSLRPDKVSASAQRLGECFVQRSLQVFIEFLRSLLQRGETLHGHPRSTQGWQKKQIQGICWILGVAPRPCGTRVVPGLSLWNQGEQHRAERGEAQSVSLKGTAQSSHWMPWIREHQKNLSGLGTCCPGCPKSGFYQLWSPWGPAGHIPDPSTCWMLSGNWWEPNLVVGRSWDLVAAGQNDRKAAGEELQNYRKVAPAVPVSQGACKVFAPFILGMNLITWPQYLQEVKISMWFFQATLATSYFEICLAPHIIFLLNSTLDSCSFILLPPKFYFFQLQVLLFLPVNNSPHTHTFSHFLQLLHIFLHQISHHDLTRWQHPLVIRV